MANVLGVQPTRMELNTLKNRLAVAKRGHNSLKEKQDELINQFIQLIRKNNELRNEVEDELAKALNNFALASSLMNQAFVDELVAIPKASVELDIDFANRMGVKVPNMSFNYSQEENSENAYGYLNTSSELDESLDILKDITPKLLELAEVEKAAQLMADELEVTRRRVNSLEYLMIPRYAETIKFIEMKLEENERSQKISMMKVKDMRQDN